MTNKFITRILFVLLALTLMIGCEPRKASVEKPKETITLERAHEMFQAYQPRYNALTEFRGGMEDASYGWHSLDFYKNYIAYLEDAAKKVNMEVSGLRLYYVAYPNDEQAGNQRDYQTYLFVPTFYDKAANKHVAFDPLHVDEQGNPLPIHDVITRGKGLQSFNGQTPAAFTGVQYRTVAAATPSSIANMGQMCKPNCTY